MKSEEKQKYFSSKNISIFFLIIQAVSMASLQCLIVLCMLNLCVQNIQGQVNPAALANMIQYFDNNVQPKTKIGTNAQYAIAISVPQDLCTNQQSHIENVFSREEAQYVFAVPQMILLICLLQFCTCAVGQNVHPKTLMNIVQNFENKLSGMGQYAVAFRVEKQKCQDSSYGGQELITRQVKEKLQRNEVYVSGDLIAARAEINDQDHSEYRLRNYLKNILNVKNQCVVYFTVNSPCLDKCISESGKFSIRGNLKNVEKYEGIKAFAFKIVWKRDKIAEVTRRLKEIAAALPYYHCEANKAECDRLSCLP
ncbi:hypothetical protein cypCar_00028221 [Cyprinus carpio]|nr:hypothetical protein cypCar_00028221 [Cyprinus carpio]